jgi:radical SAM protein with 4Fe4S-binding SPASM domain
MLFQIKLGLFAFELMFLRSFRRLLAPKTYINFGDSVVHATQVAAKPLPRNALTWWLINELQHCYRLNRDETTDRLEKKRYNQLLNDIESQQRTERVYSYPTRMSIEMTRNCNLRCRMCPQNWLEVDKREISEQVIDSIKFLIPYQNYIAVFGFGESLTSQHFFDYLDRLPFHTQQTVSLITNGILLTPSVSQKIIAGPINELLVSIDTIDAQTYTYIRQANLLPTIIENIREFNRLRITQNTKKPNLRLGFVAMRKNIEQLPDFIRFAKEVDAGDVDVGYLNVFSEDFREESLYYFPELATRVFQESQQIAQSLQVRLNIPELNRYQLTDEGICTSNQFDKQCLEPWQYIYINSNGTITPCCINISILGDLTKTDFASIWNNDQYRALRRNVNTAAEPYRCKYCFDCRYKDIKNLNHQMIVVEPGPR